MLLPKIKKIPKNTNGRLAIPALAGLLVFIMHDCLHDMIQSDIPIMRFVYSDCILDIRLCLFPVYMFTQFLLNFASTSRVFIAAVK